MNIEFVKLTGLVCRKVIVITLALMVSVNTCPAVSVTDTPTASSSLPADLEAMIVGGINSSFSDSNSEEFHKWSAAIENLQQDVTVKSLHCDACVIKLKPGKITVGNFLEDVESLSLIIEAKWDGKWTQSGSTTVKSVNNLETGTTNLSVLHTTNLEGISQISAVDFSPENHWEAGTTKFSAPNTTSLVAAPVEGASRISASDHQVGRQPYDVEARMVAEMNSALSDVKSPSFAKYKTIIESLHKTVTVKSLRCKACSIKLRAGKHVILDDVKDVEFVSFVVEGTWDGWVEKGGTTTILLERNMVTGVEKWSLVNTTARVAVTPEKAEAYKDTAVTAAITAAITAVVGLLVEFCK